MPTANSDKTVQLGSIKKKQNTKHHGGTSPPQLENHLGCLHSPASTVRRQSAHPWEHGKESVSFPRDTQSSMWIEVASWTHSLEPVWGKKGKKPTDWKHLACFWSYKAQRCTGSSIIPARNHQQEAWGSANRMCGGELWDQPRTGREETTLRWVSVSEPGILLNLNIRRSLSL